MSGKKIRLKVAVALVVLASIFVVVKVQSDHVRILYSKIENQEEIRDDVPVTKGDLAALENCNRSDNCVRDFYDAYTMKNGVEKAFAHLARLQKEDPDMLPNCHYITHGIGHAALRLNGGNAVGAFTAMESGIYFKNIQSCGSGFFHGILEEIAKDIHNRDELASLLSKICQSDKIRQTGTCLHGIGHAAFVQQGTVADMLYVCDHVTKRLSGIFDCDSGGFMEYAEEIGHIMTIKDGVPHFTLCDTLDKKYQPACYIEHTTAFEWVVGDSQQDYTRNMGACKGIPDPINRMACVKLFAIRSVRIAHFKDVPGMCANTSSRAERVMCTAVVADKIAGSMDSTTRSSAYGKGIADVCGTLGADANACLNIIKNDKERLFYTSARDLEI